LPKINSGIEFEKVVADIQAQVDPNADVIHNENIVDRLGQRRQFDVVIRGKFAGQDILGVIECKDLRKKVGTPEIDAFVTKSGDINANFKIVVSRRGFTKPAIEKARHYGIQTLSLLPNDKVNYGFRVGNFWHANIFYWKQLSLKLIFVEQPGHPINIDIHNVKIRDKKVLDWFTNYLLANHADEDKLGWVVGVGIEFETVQNIKVNYEEEFVCRGIEFYAERSLVKKQKFVGINGVGFFDWQQSRATLPAQKNIRTDSVQTNFMDWEDRKKDELNNSGFLDIKIIGHNSQFEFIQDVIDLELV